VAEGVRGIVTFLYETPFLDLEVYRLLTILEASPALAEFEGKYENQKIRRLRDVLCLGSVLPYVGDVRGA
jgi:hypothetical protein